MNIDSDLKLKLYNTYQNSSNEYSYYIEKLSVIDPVGWIKANVRASGLYIVNYDKANWIKLIKQLKNYHVVRK